MEISEDLKNRAPIFMQFVAELPQQTLHRHLAKWVILQQTDDDSDGLVVDVLRNLEIEFLLDVDEQLCAHLIFQENEIKCQVECQQSAGLSLQFDCRTV